ncbi:MAG: RluA family pseudouridine synthase [Oscillospiraceae bacterium]|nr:RluA family pseudouridine synthase [Oscillospiraceae bacterium]
MKRFVINSNDAGQRVDKFITKACPAMPKSALYKAIRKKDIKLNRKRCEISDRLSEGDVLEIYLPDDMFESGQAPDLDRISDDIHVIYEDKNIILINKPQGLVVHEDNENTADNLANRLKAYLYRKGEYDPQIENSFAPALCNRLDRNTGGIVIAAKNAVSLRLISQAIKDRTIDKYYLCAVYGCPPETEDTLVNWLYKDSSNNRVFVQDKSTPANKEIRTHYKVVKRAGDHTILEIKLLTGRTHQIRAHMAHIGCPMVGDGKYGNERKNRAAGVSKQLLFSYKLVFSFADDSELAYLNGKEFTVPGIIENIENALNRKSPSSGAKHS